MQILLITGQFFLYQREKIYETMKLCSEKEMLPLRSSQHFGIKY